MIPSYRGDKLKIRLAPDPVLWEVCKPVSTFDGELAGLTKEMLRCMRAWKGAGLAAPQVGFPIRVFVTDFKGGMVFVNPDIDFLDWSPIFIQEGCLSIPNERRDISRARHVRVRAQDTSGAPFTYEAKDFQAIVVQHELDHLDGVLMTDRRPI